MGTDALDAMLYSINLDGTTTLVNSFGNIVNEPAELKDTLNSLNDGSWSYDIPIMVVTDLSQSHDFYTVDHVIKMKQAYLQYFDKFIRYPIAVREFCPNKRVSYLAAHARKKRTRKKNFNRAIRILQRNDIL